MSGHILRGMRKWLPPEGLRLLRHWFGFGVRISGDFATWEQASAYANGYAVPEILSRVVGAAAAVRDGKASFERDGVLFDTPDYPYPLIAGLMRVAAQNQGRLSVVDLGGSLGSTYFQCRNFFSRLSEVKWCVVEQPHFVQIGQEQFTDSVLSFSDDLNAACMVTKPDVVIFSGVLQYLLNPVAVLQQVVQVGVSCVIIDRTPVIAGERDIIALQSVSTRISASSYPIRLFRQDSLLNPFGKAYILRAEFMAVDGILGGLRRPVPFMGFILERFN